MLLLTRCLYTPAPEPTEAVPDTLDAGARTVLAAIIPVLLQGALPATPDAPAARAETLARVEAAVAGLPPATRKEIAELFSLLSFAPTRCLVAGVWSSWSEATADSVAAFLARWRDSRFALLRSGYAALHQLVFAAWYADPRAWAATGYVGPPALEIG